MVLVLTHLLQLVAATVALLRPFVAVISPEPLSIGDDPWFPPGLARLCVPLRI
jgi:hypothetical protein